MKYLQIASIILLFVISACSSKNEKASAAKNNAIEEKFPIDYIRKVSMERRKYYNLDSLDAQTLTPIDSSFFKKWFDKRTVDNDNSNPIKFDLFSRYYFFDFKDAGKTVLFSIIWMDETGYNLFYNITYNKSSEQLERVDLIAVNGGDGGQSVSNYLNFNVLGDGLNLTTVISDEYSRNDHNYVIQVDSVLTKIELLQPKVSYSTNDSKRVKEWRVTDSSGNTIRIGSFSTLPPEIDGCSCVFSIDTNDFKNNRFIYVNNYEQTSYMKVNGSLVKFTQVDVKENDDNSLIEYYKSDNFEMIIKGKDEGRNSDETWLKRGRIIIKNKKGSTILLNFYGECGC
ncbi:hypothetical protein [Solitalea canadensis]|uniref:Lipoprotein n=1 Tax=Solitalea canadensis (strain ATCC 29591 / DSM 3403 / JCM 21819 / LMG 8368 / NBRC 15130 / NCIMB 12057 / USAM 9D) TaxID=929556 RepID=H8KS87_SOLCM|nr:hypothetical protein [Solitalea canadensis]AFD07875.1 hypothetical protein Solca_2850 [Solitalea canadensis DSM 3403]